MKAGRKTKYKPEFNNQAYKLALLGATDKELANFFEVSESTLNLWKDKHHEFSESIKNGKIKADAEVAESLHKRAKGFTHLTKKVIRTKEGPKEATHEDYYPPDTAAAYIWLKNRQPDKWRDKRDEITEDSKQVTKVKLPDGTIIEV